MRRNYLKYMGSLDLKIGGKYVFYDFVSSGTCQKALSKIVPFELCGLYFGWNGQDNLYDVSKEALFNGGNSFFVRNYKILEVFMTSDKPSLKAIDKLGEPVFADELRSKEEIEMVGAIHQAISDYFAVFVKSLYIPGEEFDVSCADRLLSCIESTDFTKLNYGLYGLELNDDWKSERRLLSEIL